jgi:hypothetical protein
MLASHANVQVSVETEVFIHFLECGVMVKHAEDIRNDIGTDEQLLRRVEVDVNVKRICLEPEHRRLPFTNLHWYSKGLGWS